MSRRPAASATLGADAQDIDGEQKGPCELALFGRRQISILPAPSRPSGALARRDRNGQALGDLEDATLVRSPGASIFVALGTVTLPWVGRVFYLILSDAPLARDPKWVLILTWTRQSSRPDDLLERGAHVGSLKARGGDAIDRRGARFFPFLCRQSDVLPPRLSARNLAACSAIVTLALASSTWADETDSASESADAPLTAPFVAEVKTAIARAHLRPGAASPEVGLLRKGAVVTVTVCRPDCAALKGWGLLGADGAVELDRLSPLPEPAEASAGAPAASLWYGRVGKSGIKIFREPRLQAPLLTRKRISREMAFSPNVDLRRTGWLERAKGGSCARAAWRP